MSPIITPRLVLRELNDDDAPFIFELLNEADFLRFIGDKGVNDRSIALHQAGRGRRGSSIVRQRPCGGRMPSTYWFVNFSDLFPESAMQPFPHHYTVSATIRPDGDVPLSTEGVRVIESSSPKEFDGPGNQWSPEGLLTAAVADCLALSFRAIALASKYSWHSLEVRTEGTLNRVNGMLRFTQFATHARLHMMPGADAARGKLLLEKAESNCLVSNSLNADRLLTTEVV